MVHRPTRRGYLAGLAAAGLAGCLSEDGGPASGEETATETPGRTRDDPGETATASPEPTRSLPTVSPDECPAEPRVPDTVVDEDDMPPVPDRPESLDDEAVTEYVSDYEYAYKYRSMAGYGDGIVEFNLTIEPTVAERGSSWVVVTSDYTQDYGRWDDGDGTPHGHFDGYRYSLAYLVTDEAVRRATNRETGDPPDPREEGQLLECF